MSQQDKIFTSRHKDFIGDHIFYELKCQNEAAYSKIHDNTLGQLTWQEHRTFINSDKIGYVFQYTLVYSYTSAVPGCKSSAVVLATIDLHYYTYVITGTDGRLIGLAKDGDNCTNTIGHDYIGDDLTPGIFYDNLDKAKEAAEDTVIKTFLTKNIYWTW